MNENNDNQLKVLLMVGSVFFFLAVIPIWPIGFYTLLRIVICGIAAFAAYQMKRTPNREKHFVPLVIIAAVFNPIIPVYLYDRLLWLPIDLAGGIYFFMLSRKR